MIVCQGEKLIYPAKKLERLEKKYESKVLLGSSGARSCERFDKSGNLSSSKRTLAASCRNTCDNYNNKGKKLVAGDKGVGRQKKKKEQVK